MDVSSSMWLPKLEMVDTAFINEYEMNSLYNSADSFSVDSFSSQSYKENHPSNLITASNGGTHINDQSFQTSNINGDLAKQPPNSIITTTKPFFPPSSNSFTISFEKPNTENSNEFYGDLVKPKDEIPNDLLGFSPDSARIRVSNSRNPLQAQDHVLAERKRRETLTRRFISLSALLPNLKKMDKASVLEDAVKYIRELQGHVKELEEESIKTKKDIDQSVVSVKRSRVCSEDDVYSFDDNSASSPYKLSPEIEVRISGSSVLVRIYCQNHSSLLVKALTELENLRLTIISSSAMPFSNTTLLITIVAQKGDEFFMTAMDIVQNLQSAILSFT